MCKRRVTVFVCLRSQLRCSLYLSHASDSSKTAALDRDIGPVLLHLNEEKD